MRGSSSSATVDEELCEEPPPLREHSIRIQEPPLLQVWPTQEEEDAAKATEDSGIASVDPSPSSPSTKASPSLLHPHHALRRHSAGPRGESENSHHTSLEDVRSCSSSTTSSQTSVAITADRRRSSSMTVRYSLFDALDLEYALLRAAARGSIGPYSLSGSIHKLTFTQSLAFPALARGLAYKRRNSRAPIRSLDREGGGMQACAKVITALLLCLFSVLVFGIVYKFVRT